MATRFNFSIESDGLNNEQAATFAAFVKSLQVKSELGPHVVNAGIPVEYFVHDKGVAEHDAPVKKKRASKLSVAAGSGTIEELEQEEKLKASCAIDKAVAEQEAEAAQMVAEEAKSAQYSNKEDLVRATTEEAVFEETAEKKATPPISSITLDTLKKLVGEKQAKHRDEIKAYFLKKGGYKTTTLPDKLYGEFHNLLTSMK